jgi:hypothetical protein
VTDQQVVRLVRHKRRDSTEQFVGDAIERVQIGANLRGVAAKYLRRRVTVTVCHPRIGTDRGWQERRSQIAQDNAIFRANKDIRWFHPAVAYLRDMQDT